jgi:hypothetical protein
MVKDYLVDVKDRTDPLVLEEVRFRNLSPFREQEIEIISNSRNNKGIQFQTSQPDIQELSLHSYSIRDKED